MILSRVFDGIYLRSIPKMSRTTVRRTMMQRATRPVTLATSTRYPLSRVKFATVAGVTSVLESCMGTGMAVIPW